MKTWRTLTSAGAVVAALVIAGSAQADDACAPSETMLKGLHDRYEESPSFSGVMQNGMPFTITVSPKGTWTFLIIRADGLVCAVTGGANWAAKVAETVAPAPQSLPTPALLPHHMLRI